MYFTLTDPCLETFIFFFIFQVQLLYTHTHDTINTMTNVELNESGKIKIYHSSAPPVIHIRRLGSSPDDLFKNKFKSRAPPCGIVSKNVQMDSRNNI